MFHSTETDLLKYTTIYICEHECPRLELARLSAVFDTIDHDGLTESLEAWYGINGIAVKWVNFHIAGRKQTINISDTRSESVSTPVDVFPGLFL